MSSIAFSSKNKMWRCHIFAGFGSHTFIRPTAGGRWRFCMPSATNFDYKERSEGGGIRQPTLSACSRPAPIRLLIVEDHPVFQAGLSSILASQGDTEEVASATSASDAVEKFRHHQPDITLMGLHGATGVEALLTLRAEFPGARVIMLANADGDAAIQRALRAGAASYVLKSAAKSELLKTIRSVRDGRRSIPPDVAVRLAEHLGTEDLTIRELEVLTLIRDGNRNRQIAGRLSISETTVNFHIRNLVDKLQANDRTHAVIIAIRRGLLQI
jgi:DNA-binding NarL/FixJ family response regulator